MRIFSMGVSCSFFRDKVGVLHARLGIDIQAARPAPIGKLFGVDVGAHNDVTLACVLLLDSFGFREPYSEPAGEFVAVGHDPEASVVILGVIPGDTKGVSN
ncbi:MAG: hypothetical protein JSR51_00480 [Proteobacteria bacterium]|nr:hypothetical protein [Pseudomonadota bacterium]